MDLDGFKTHPNVSGGVWVIKFASDQFPGVR